MNSATNPAAGDQPASTAHDLFARESLPDPPVPAHLAASLRAEGDIVFTTRPLTASPYDLDWFAAEVESGPGPAPYAVVGFDGHGINSWAAHCYVVDAAIALFIQLPWGGAYLDVEPAREDIVDMFAWGQRLQAMLAQALRDGKIPAGWRLQVVASRYTQPGWRWLVPGRDNAATPLNPAGGMKATLEQLVDEILAGRQALHGAAPAP